MEFDAAPGFPDSGVVTDLGTLHEDHKILGAGETLCLSVTNGTTADPPAFLLQIAFTEADAE
jgi:hypothetical protein